MSETIQTILPSQSFEQDWVPTIPSSGVREYTIC